MKPYQMTTLALGIVILLAACAEPAAPPIPTTPGTTPTAAPETGMRMGMGMRSEMMARHRAPVPEPYAGITYTASVDDDMLLRGADLYATHCATCHGDGGMGDGPAGVSLDPAPSPIAHTSQMMGDDYLFWRVSEGGAPFSTAMPVWKDTLDEQERWDVIYYTRALGKGQVIPGRGMGGAAFDPQEEAAHRAEMLAQGIAKGVITQAEADTFSAVHTAMDNLQATQSLTAGTGNPGERQAVLLSALVTTRTITQAQADAFTGVHDRLEEAGLMQ